jgi:tetratricopeptide (TPR) repeat protein
MDLGGVDRLKKAREWHEKGLALTELWLKAKPGDPSARGHRAAYAHLLGTSYHWLGDRARADALFKEALAERRALWNNREYRRQVDRFTPGKSYSNLCDSLDQFRLFDESLKLREEAYKQFGTFELLDAWCWTCWKAGMEHDARKKAHLLKSAELSAKLHGLRPTNRTVLRRWAFVLRDLGELESTHGHVAEAREHYNKWVEVAKKLATAADLARQREQYARACFELGVLEKRLGHGAEARKHFRHARLIREVLLRDYPDHPFYVHLRIDWLFAVVALGEHVTAARVADEIAAKHQRDGRVLYRLGVIYERCVGAVAEARRPASPTAADRQLQGAYDDKAFACFRRAAERMPFDRQAREAAADGFARRKDLDGPISVFRKWAEIQPRNPQAHFSLGVALADKGDYEAAIAAYREVVRLDPNHAGAHCNLGMDLARLGRFTEGLPLLRRGHALGSRQPQWKAPSGEWLRYWERQAELDGKVGDNLRRRAAPRDPGERVEVALACMKPYRRLYGASARLFAGAFADRPALAADLQAGHRYNAACSAALVGSAQGKDAAGHTARERADWRRQALAWLRADLAAWAERGKGDRGQAAAAAQALRHWEADADLAGVRGAAVAKLPEGERAAWRQLWAGVAAQLRRLDASAK